MNLEPYLIDFDSLNEGDQIYYIRRGFVRIVRKDRGFFVVAGGITVLPNGKITNHDEHPSFFKSNPFEAPEPVSEYPKAMMVEGSAGRPAVQRVVIGEFDGRYIAINDHRTLEQFIPGRNFGVTLWQTATDITPEPLTPKTVLSRFDIARLAGCTVEDLEILED